jgi:hypothetical protein
MNRPAATKSVAADRSNPVVRVRLFRQLGERTEDEHEQEHEEQEDAEGIMG